MALWNLKPQSNLKAIMPLHYMTKLRSFISTGQRAEDDSSGARYIDTLAFWKDSHLRLQQELNEQRARIYTLERELDASRSASALTSSQAIMKRGALKSGSIGRGKKRKRGTADGNEIKTETQDGSNTVRGLPSGSFGSLNESLSRAHEAGLPDAVYALQKSLSSSPLDPSTTASIVRFLISEIHRSAVPTDMSPNHSFSQTQAVHTCLVAPAKHATANASRASSNGGDFGGTTTSAIFLSLLNALESLGSVTEVSIYQRQLIYDIVELLRDLLDHMCDLAATNTRQNHACKALAPERRSTRSKKQTTYDVPRLAPDDNTMKLCRLITYALQNMKKEREADRAIVEGFTFFLLRRVGEVLRSFVFGEEDVGWKGVWAPEDTRDVQWGPSGDERLRQEQRTAKEAQAPYLIWLLERAMTCFSSARNTIDKSLASRQSIVKSASKAGQVILCEQVKLKLQHTILKDVIGQDVQEFKDSLYGPQNPQINVEPWAEIPRSDVVSTFKAEVWRLIGWECLKDSIDWERPGSR
ncbi:MAG: hypothetical protein LQ352_004644 [Teloschistes flavicans]|nr:MAG: hypothetical protein LQ352_004644 [Teloschistes flavicans]